MTDYNDGKWHPLTGGKCPKCVDPKSTVEWKNSDGKESKTLARSLSWEGEGKTPVIAFRVIKAHREPREFWVSYDSQSVCEMYHSGMIHVREVIE